MDKVDQFESLFKSAAKEPFQRQDVRVTSALVVADGDEEAVKAYADQIRGFLPVLGANVRWTDIPSSAFSNIQELMEILEREDPDLICTHRHVGSPNQRWAWTLGEVLDVLTQATDRAVMVLPHPDSEDAKKLPDRDTGVVMVMTDHLTGDGRLVSHALRYTTPKGRLVLCHVEDDTVLARYTDAIAKIPEMDTESVTELLRERLLKDPADYIESCQEALAEAGVPVTIEADVGFGHRLTTWKRLVDAHEASLLVMNTKDEDQDAMHGLAHPIAIEMRQVPLLML